MKFKRVFALLLVLCTVLLAGCGSMSESISNGVSMDMASPELGEVSKGDSTSSSQETVQNTNQKLIRKVWLDAETEDMDGILVYVDEKIGALGGYVESREVNNYSYSRRAELTIRIPAEKLDQFTEAVKENANITSATETADDITLSYVAVESRVNALETEQTRLLELLAQAENMEEILLIEERLTNVRAELEEVTSQLRVYDNQVSYGTVYLSIHEVKEYTEAEPEGFFQRIGSGFMDSLEGVGNGIVEFVIFLIVASPYLVLIALILTVVILVARKIKKKKAKQTKEEDRK